MAKAGTGSHPAQDISAFLDVNLQARTRSKPQFIDADSVSQPSLLSTWLTGKDTCMNNILANLTSTENGSQLGLLNYAYLGLITTASIHTAVHVDSCSGQGFKLTWPFSLLISSPRVCFVNYLWSCMSMVQPRNFDSAWFKQQLLVLWYLAWCAVFEKHVFSSVSWLNAF